MSVKNCSSVTSLPGLYVISVSSALTTGALISFGFKEPVEVDLLPALSSLVAVAVATKESILASPPSPE